MLSILLAACTKDEASGGGLVGTLSTPEGTTEVHSAHGFGYHYEGKGMWFFPSGEEQSCAVVSEYLIQDKVDPAGIWDPQSCILTLVLNDYTGDSTTLDVASENFVGGFWSFKCGYGEGEFVFEQRGDDEDWFWSGPQWTGEPYSGTTTVAGDTEFSVDAELGGFTGSYSDVIGEVAAEGSVSGHVDATECPELYQVDAFPKQP